MSLWNSWMYLQRGTEPSEACSILPQDMKAGCALEQKGSLSMKLHSGQVCVRAAC